MVSAVRMSSPETCIQIERRRALRLQEAAVNSAVEGMQFTAAKIWLKVRRQVFPAEGSDVAGRCMAPVSIRELAAAACAGYPLPPVTESLRPA